MSTIVTDDAFEAFAKQAEKEAKERSSRSAGGGSYTRDLEELQWTGLVSNEMKLIRAVGGPPDSNLDAFTARTARVSWILGDGQKKFKVVLPERSESPDHVLWRIIERVNKPEWIDRKKVIPIEQKHPDIYRLINKNGLKESDNQYKFDRGWEGRHVLLMNVLDREQGAWHADNKHTLLLSRNVGEKDGKLFPEDGVPSYGFISQLTNLFKYYQSWEKYDIGIVRTGLKESPYRIINASKYFEEVPAALKDYVSDLPLTDEEASYARYDLSRIYRPSTHTKIYNRLRGKIAQIDDALHSKFLRELEDAVAIEKEQFAALYGNAAEVTEDGDETSTKVVIGTAGPLPGSAAPTPAAPQEAPFTWAPTRTRTPVKEAATSFDTSYLKGWDQLTQDEKDGIVNIVVKEGKLVDIEYKDPSWTTLRCPDCGVPAPDFYSVCPACGLRFS